MLPLEHSAKLLTCIKQLLVSKTYFCHLFEWPLKIGFTVFEHPISHIACPLTKRNHQHLQCNSRAMIRQICSIKPEDVTTVRSRELLAKRELEDLGLILRERRLCWFGRVERSSGAVRTACDIQVDGRHGQG